MNDNIDLTKILKDCPKGWKLWSPIFGDVVFHSIIHEEKRVYVISKTDEKWYINADATITLFNITSIEIMLYPSKDQRDWSKFTAPWYKKEKLVELPDKFDPNTLQPFDRVLMRTKSMNTWEPDFFGYIDGHWFMCVTTGNVQCIPYNEDTKHLIGTKEEAPEYYRYWED